MNNVAFPFLLLQEAPKPIVAGYIESNSGHKFIYEHGILSKKRKWRTLKSYKINKHRTLSKTKSGRRARVKKNRKSVLKEMPIWKCVDTLHKLIVAFVGSQEDGRRALRRLCRVVQPVQRGRPQRRQRLSRSRGKLIIRALH